MRMAKIVKKYAFDGAATEAQDAAASSLRLTTGSGGRRLSLHLGSTAPADLAIAAMRYFDDDMYAVAGLEAELPAFIDAARKIDPHFHCYPDALNYILEARDRHRRRALLQTLADSDISANGHAADIRAAFEAGRILMVQQPGTDKAVAALGTAELMRRHNMIASVLVICPTALKYKWKKEIERLTGSEAVVVEGMHTQRRALYRSEARYKIVSYHALANDIRALGTLTCDFVILDEVQRLNGRNPQLAQAAKRVGSDYCVALSAVPVAEKPDEYYALRTAEATEAAGTVHICVPMTKEQRSMYDDCSRKVVQAVERWQQLGFLSEKDRKRLLWNIGQMRMACDSTALPDRKVRSDTKPGEAVQYLQAALTWSAGKAVVFTRWERMARIMADELERAGMGERVSVFTDGGACRGRAPQGVSHIVHLDVPLTAAALERRKACAGGGDKVQTVYLISAATIEESIVATAAAERNIFDGLPYDDAERITLDDVKLDRLCKALAQIIPAETAADSSPAVADGDEQASPATGSSTEAAELLSRGISIAGELARTLQTPDGAARLIDSLVHTDNATGRCELRIPVESKGDVAAIVNLIAKFLSR